METKAERLRWARESANYRSAAQFAREHGFSEITYRAHENGFRQLTETAAKAYAEHLGVTWVWLLTGLSADQPSLASEMISARAHAAAKRTQPNAAIRTSEAGLLSAPAGLPSQPATKAARGVQSTEASRIPMPSGTFFGQPDLPVYGHARGGADGFFLDNGTIQGYVARPEALADNEDAYCVIVNNDSMEPVFADGHLLYVDPRRPVQPGDDVVLELADGQAFVKRLQRRGGGKVTVRQFNPDRELAFPSETVRTIHLVVGSLRVRI